MAVQPGKRNSYSIAISLLVEAKAYRSEGGSHHEDIVLGVKKSPGLQWIALAELLALSLFSIKSVFE